MRDIQVNGEISALQDFLADNDYLSDKKRGYFGPKTVAAVKSFQKDNSLLASGYVGPVTRAKIESVSCDTGTVSANPPLTDTNIPVINNISVKMGGQENKNRGQVVIEGKNLNNVDRLIWTLSGTAISGVLQDSLREDISGNKVIFYVYQYEDLLNKLKNFELSKYSLNITVKDEVIGKVSGTYRVDLNTFTPFEAQQNLRVNLIR